MLNSIRLALGVLVVMCLSSAALAQVPPANDPDMKELLAYRLTLPALNKVIAATRNLAASIKTDPRFLKNQALKAEIKKLEEKEEPTEADSERIEQLRAEREKLEKGVFDRESTKTLSDMAAGLEKEPIFAKALAGAGLSAREYAKFLLAYFQAGMVHGMMKSGMVKEIPKEMAGSVNMENVKFVAEHEAELTAFAKEMAALDPDSK